MKLKRNILILTGLLVLAQTRAATFTVINTNSDGAGSLRQAILDSNATNGTDTIAFDIPGTGPHRITPTNTLPTITDPVVIDGYTQSGASMNTSTNGLNTVITIELDGESAGTIPNGLLITAGDTTVRGLAIFQFGGGGNANIRMTTAGGNVVEGNFLGTDATGTNLVGVGGPAVLTLSTSPGNRIGGTNEAARNLLSACASVAVQLGSSSNVVQGNLIGTDLTGTTALPNTVGIAINGDANLVGGTEDGARNVISGNSGSGVGVLTGSGNTVQGNYIGVDLTGTNKLGNSVGVTIGGSESNQIGGAISAARNIISGNTSHGVHLNGNANMKFNRVEGNYIGTDVTGTMGIGNNGNGIFAFSGSDNFIVSNVISSNHFNGFTGQQFFNYTIQGNLIGTDATGTGALGNGADGVFLFPSSGGFVIGGTGAGEANTIAFNDGIGVEISAAGGFMVTNNSIRQNSIFSNGGIGIDLTPTAGVTSNDTCDVDSGASTPNNLQNFPVLTNVTSDASSVTIEGFLDSVPNTMYTLEFFANTECDPSGFGEGEFFLAATNLIAGADCTNFFSYTFPVSVPAGMYMTATATDPFGNTSEFSACFTNTSSVIVADCSLAPFLATNIVETLHMVTMTVTTNGNPAVGVGVSFNVVSGPNAGQTAPDTTDTNGQADFSYVSDGTPGTDIIEASGSIDGLSFTCTATKVWISAGPTNQPPVAVCQSVTTNADASCQASPSAANFDGGSFDNDGSITGRSINPSGPFSKGVQQVILTVTDNDGASDSCTTTVTVVDSSLPAITCPGNVTSNVAAGVTNTVVDFGPPTASDNCPGLTTDCVPPSGSTFSLGTNTVTCTAIDAAANTNACTFSVIVTAAPNQPPVAQCSNIAVNANAGCQANVPAIDVDAGSFDPDGSIADGTLSPAGPFALGTNDVTLTVFDNQGASNSCTAQIIVVDISPPTIGPCAAITTNVPAGVTNAIVTFSDPTTGDNCGVAGVACVPASGTSFPLGTTPVACTVTDTSGNTNSCTFDVTVQETAPEVHDLALIKLKAPKNINLKGADPSLTKFVKVTLQNRSPHDEAIADLTGLVTLVAESLSNVCPNATVVLHEGPPNKTKTLKPKQKLTVTFDVTYDCANDPSKGAGHEDFRYTATVNHAAIDGNADTHPDDDDCPRVPLPGGGDPNPDPDKPLKDKGCGNKDKVTKQVGADVLTDVFMK